MARVRLAGTILTGLLGGGFATCWGTEWFGANLPWVHYGDIGCNAWGCRGFSTLGFVAETYPGARCLTDVRHVASNPFSGQPALAFRATCDGRDPAAAAGELYTDPSATAPVPCPKRLPGTLLDLEGVTLRTRICFPPGSAGSPQAPNTVQFLFKSRVGEEFPSLYSEPVPIAPSWEQQCADLEFRVSNAGPGHRFGAFDARRVALVGLRIAAGAARLDGEFYLERLVLETQPPIVYDFRTTALEEDLVLIRRLAEALGARPVARVFTLVDGRSGIEFASDGTVRGLQQQALRDFEALVEAARKARVWLMPVLFDFGWFSRPRQVSGVQLGGRSYFARDPVARQTLLDRVLAPLLERHGNEPWIYAWEVINEPEWVTTGIAGFRPDEREHDPVTLAEMREFVRACADLVRKFTRHQVTTGSARRSWTPLWDGLGLSLHSFHFYDWDRAESFPWRPWTQLGLDGPVLIGEVPTSGSSFRPGDYLRAARAGGYAGVCLWSCRAADAASDFPAAAADLWARVPQVSLPGLVNAASFAPGPLVPDAWFSLFGENLASGLSTDHSLPLSLGDTAVSIAADDRAAYPARLLFVAPGQINLLAPGSVRPGRAVVTVRRLDGGVAAVEVPTARVSPGLFTADGSGRGIAAALIARVRGGQVTRVEPVFDCEPAGGACRERTFVFGPPDEEAVLMLFGTGIRHRADSTQIFVRAGGDELPLLYAGAQGQYAGLDQINVLLPRALAGKGTVEVVLVVEGQSSNAVTLRFD
ncbi:MAG: hypothetical protein RMK57_05340 [Bryobacterales bacterium]|nr:hypothetical protein [Bryobacteraceae bacterium]MDW8353938.1 hypothetical protein [Bryobacterales bacterium]